MRTQLKDNILTLYPEGRIDSGNASRIEQELSDAAAQSPEAGIVIDAEKLEYISSAGLRILMKLRKQTKAAIPVINVSPEIYEIFEVTGFTELLDVHKRLREISVEGCRVIGQGGFGTVYRLDEETIVKVYRPGMPRKVLDEERAMAQKAFLLGVPTAIAYDVVRCGDSFGLIFEMINARTVASAVAENPDLTDAYAHKCANVLKDIHSIGMEAGDLPDCRQKFRQWAESMSRYLDYDEVSLLLNYLDNNVPDGSSFLHGDFHSKNIMDADGELMLIDIGDAAMGHPAFDLGQIFFTHIIMPKTTRSAEQATQLLGFSPETAQRFWGVLASTYFGTSDPVRIRQISAMLTPLALFGLAFHATRYTAGDEERTAGVADKLIRGQLLPALIDPVQIDF